MTAAVKERGILMSDPMIRALMRVDPKTQTRRLMMPQPDNPQSVFGQGVPIGVRSDVFSVHARVNGEDIWIPCPQGKPSDHLWVRERHAYLDVTKSALSQFPLGPQNDNAVGPDVWNVCVEYSDGTEHETSVEEEKPKQTRERGGTGWRSARFMHRWASRLTLEITAIRVEPLQEISEADAIAEGIRDDIIRETGDHPRLKCYVAEPDDNHAYRTAREAYAKTWDNLNGKRAPWASNPWVFVISFRRVL